MNAGRDTQRLRSAEAAVRLLAGQIASARDRGRRTEGLERRYRAARETLDSLRKA